MTRTCFNIKRRTLYIVPSLSVAVFRNGSTVSWFSAHGKGGLLAGAIRILPYCCELDDTLTHASRVRGARRRARESVREAASRDQQEQRLTSW